MLPSSEKGQARRSESRAPYDWWDAEMKGGFDVPWQQQTRFGVRGGSVLGFRPLW